MKKAFFFTLTFIFALLLFSGQAYALAISPGSGYLIADGDDQAGWDVWDTPSVEAILANDLGIDTSNPRVVEGFIDPSATTSNPSTISWFGEQYMLVTDGNHSPWWYLFDLPSAPGDDVIVLSGFWDGPGQVSNVRFYGEKSVPEPSTVFLLGLGLVGLAGIGRKRMKR